MYWPVASSKVTPGKTPGCQIVTGGVLPGPAGAIGSKVLVRNCVTQGELGVLLVFVIVFASLPLVGVGLPMT